MFPWKKKNGGTKKPFPWEVLMFGPEDFDVTADVSSRNEDGDVDAEIDEDCEMNDDGDVEESDPIFE